MTDIADLLIKHEGLKLFPYHCTAGKLTIGVGRNLEDRGITKGEALIMLEHDIADFTKQLSERLYWFDDQPQFAKVVLINMAFNLGMAGLLKFHNTLEHIKQGQYELAAKEMLLSKWAKQVGTRATELSNILKNKGI
jgi:lysozyme